MNFFFTCKVSPWIPLEIWFSLVYGCQLDDSGIQWWLPWPWSSSWSLHQCRQQLWSFQRCVIIHVSVWWKAGSHSWSNAKTQDCHDHEKWACCQEHGAHENTIGCWTIKVGSKLKGFPCEFWQSGFCERDSDESSRVYPSETTTWQDSGTYQVGKSTLPTILCSLTVGEKTNLSWDQLCFLNSGWAVNSWYMLKVLPE